MENTSYVPYRKRLPAFLKDFPVKDGWKRVVDPVPPSDLLPGFDAYYTRYLENCEKSNVTPQRVVAFRARLISPSGDVSVQVHKIGLIESWADLMTAETRAYDRLLIHTGHGSDVDESVDSDVKKIEESLGLNPSANFDVPDTPPPHMNVTPTVSAPAADKPKVKPTSEVPAPAPKDVPVEAVVEPKVEADPTPAQEDTAQDEDAPAEAADLTDQSLHDNAPSPSGSVPDLFLKQISMIQKQRNLPAAVPATIEEARSMLRQYMAG